MPNYDFRCNNCKHEFEERVSYAKRDEVACPNCGSKEKQQIFKAGSVKGPVGGSSSSGGSLSGAPRSSGFS